MSGHFMVIIACPRWRVARVVDGEVEAATIDGEADATVEQRADVAHQRLVDWGYAGGPILLALASSSCLCATIGTDDLERGGRRQAMGYRLEECLPISCEDVIADYVEAGHGQALGVCAETEWLRSIVGAFESVGVPVGPICPLALLAAADVLEQHPDAGGVLIGDGEVGRAYDLVELRGDRPARWWWHTADHAAVWTGVAGLSTESDRPLRLALLGCPSLVRDDARSIGSIELIETETTGQDTAGTRHAARLLAHGALPWIDLRRGALAAPGRYEVYRRPVLALAAAVVVLLVCASIAMHLHGRQYAALTDELRQEQVAVYRQATPDAGLVDVHFMERRLQSVKNQLAGLGGRAIGANDPNSLVPASALEHLYDVISGLPQDLRFRILDLDIQPERIIVDGEARSHIEAERIAGALRQTGLFEVDPPKTQSLTGHEGVSFLFSAKPVDPGTRPKEGGRR